MSSTGISAAGWSFINVATLTWVAEVLPFPKELQYTQAAIATETRERTSKLEAGFKFEIWGVCQIEEKEQTGAKRGHANI